MVGIARLDRPYRTLRLTQQRNDHDVRRSHDDARSIVRGIAVTGAIASGKTTLASALAQRIGGRHLSSDAIRRELYGDRDGNAARVFRVMEDRLLSSFEQNVPVVLDSTGMSYRFRDILQRYRAELVHVHLTVRNTKTFQQREATRIDRLPLPARVFDRSKRTLFAAAPDIVVETDDMNAAVVLKAVIVRMDARLAP